MTGPAGTSMLRRPFGIPVVLSLALHGLAVAALGTFPLVAKTPPAQNDGVRVDLVAVPPVPVARPRPVVSKPAVKKSAAPKARRIAMRRAAPRLAAAVSSHAAPVATPVALPAAVPPSPAPGEPAEAVSEAPPSFMDLPRVPAPAASPADVFAQETTFAVPEAMEPLVMLAAGTGEGAFSRPLPGISSGQVRLLRDSPPEAGSARSKVRPGNNPHPEYPRAAREAGWEGTVVLQVMVLTDGTAGNVTLHKTSGHSILDEAALAAVRGWQFIPAMDGNFPVQSVVRMPVRFDLRAAH